MDNNTYLFVVGTLMFLTLVCLGLMLISCRQSKGLFKWSFIGGIILSVVTLGVNISYKFL